MARSAADRERERQTRSNRNSLASQALFQGHRDRLTHAILERCAPRSGDRLCILGAGNCQDLELPELASRYRELHLVDLDEQALTRARDRQPRSVREQLVLHPGLDLSQLLGELDASRALAWAPERLAQQPGSAAAQIARAIGARFESVVSACVLSQMQLALCTELSEAHPLFAALSYTLGLTHLRTLAALSAPGGRALLCSDVADEQLAPLAGLGPDANLLELLAQLVLAGEVFHSVDPVLMSQMLIDDPLLARDVLLQPLRDVWLWQLTAERSYLVYALLLERRGGSPHI
ncbi:MAG: hypothetical protein ABI895_36080 [Deltaproteobacteria bacterium]